MQGKIVKRKKPLAGWIRFFLKITQHISASMGMLALAALILTGTVYVEDFGYRRWIDSDIRNENVAGNYLIQNLSRETEEAIRLAIIRSQLETGGEFDLDREINISEYYYRKNGKNYTDMQYSYFTDAVYYLEDLIRWQQSGGLKKIGQAKTYAADVEKTTNAVNTMGNVGKVVPSVENRFLTVS